MSFYNIVQCIILYNVWCYNKGFDIKGFVYTDRITIFSTNRTEFQAGKYFRLETGCHTSDITNVRETFSLLVGPEFAFLIVQRVQILCVNVFRRMNLTFSMDKFDWILRNSV